MISSQTVTACVRGVAAGDALSATAAAHRLHLLPERRSRMLQDMVHFSDRNRSTTRPVPHAHSSPTAALRPRPADDLEWFVFSAHALVAAANGESLHDRWRELAGIPELRARTGTQYALANLRAGLNPPQSGNDNPHYFDDIACVRAIAAGLLARDSAHAAELAQADAEVTHSLDGVWCAMATAVLVNALAQGAEVADAVRAAVDVLPPSSWSRRMANTALAVAAESHSALDLAFRLDLDVTDKIYTYAIAGPETLAILLAHTVQARSADELLLGAFAHGRKADSLPPLAGAIAGLRFGLDWMPQHLIDGPVEFDGICIPALAGHHLETTIDELAGAVAR